MFIKPKTSTPIEPTGTEYAIHNAMLALADLQVGSDEYAKALEHVTKLTKLKAPEKEPKKPVSPDAVIAAAANIAGILLILQYEHIHVITSKALGFVAKVKL